MNLTNSLFHFYNSSKQFIACSTMGRIALGSLDGGRALFCW